METTKLTRADMEGATYTDERASRALRVSEHQKVVLLQIQTRNLQEWYLTNVKKITRFIL